jgi:formate hydrogenlyase subunit 3/multisubunit Na+/H+ antiporter MnhD subunit
MSAVMPVFWPLLAAVALAAFPRAVRVWIGLVGVGTAWALAQLYERIGNAGPLRYQLGGWGAPLGIDLYIDGLALFMLITTWLVGLAVSLYALGYFAGAEHKAREGRYFWILWFFLWAALNALFMSADLFNLYVTLELVSIGAVALTALSASKAALTAALRYLLVGLVASLSYLMGVALLYSGYGQLDIYALAGVVTAQPLTWCVMALMLAAVMIKTALFPLHFWLPPAHSSALAPVSALLSALVVKTGFYLFVRLWFELFESVTTMALANLVGVLGAAAVLWGSIQALRTARLKLLIAYSTVAQLGYLFLLAPLAMSTVGAVAWSGVFYLLIAHACAKGALFLSAGTIMKVLGHDRLNELQGLGKVLPLTLATCALAAVSLVGLPPSGGFVAKWSLLVAAAEGGQWWWIVLLAVGGLLTAAYLFRLLSPAMAGGTFENEIRERDYPLMVWPAFALAAFALVLGVVAPNFFELLLIGAPVAAGGNGA